MENQTDSFLESSRVEPLQDFWEKKKESFIALKLWEDQRGNYHLAQKTKLHRSLIETILSRVFQKANIGREANLAIARFLKERADSELNSSNVLSSQLVYLPSQSKSSTSLKSGLSAVNSFQNQLCESLKNFSGEIE